MKYLVIEDDPTTSQIICKALESTASLIDTSFDGPNGLKKAQHNKYDAIIVDVLLPELSGLSILENLRKQENHTPIMIISALHELKNKIQGLSLGADDYMTKPFDVIELQLRVKNLLKKKFTRETLTQLFYRDLSLDRLKRTAERQSKNIDLQEKEYLLLELFLSKPNEIISKAHILKRVWDYDYDPNTNIVDVLVCRLRNKIEKEFQSRLIYTIRNIGYILK